MIRTIGLGDTYTDLEARYNVLVSQWTDVENYVNATFSPRESASFDSVIDAGRNKISAINAALASRDGATAAMLMDGFNPLAIKNQISRGVSGHMNASIGLVVGVLALGATLWMFHKTVNL